MVTYIYALHLQLVGKPVVDFIFVINWAFFVIFYGWDVISGNLSKSAFFEGGGSPWAQISDGRGRRPPIIVGVKKLVIVFLCGIKISAVHCLVFVTKHTCDRHTDEQMDRRTDRQTELRLPRPHSCSRGNDEEVGQNRIHAKADLDLNFERKSLLTTLFVTGAL